MNLGDIFGPVGDAIDDLASGVKDFAEDHPILTSAIVIGTGLWAAGAFTAAGQGVLASQGGMALVGEGASTAEMIAAGGGNTVLGNMAAGAQVAKDAAFGLAGQMPEMFSSGMTAAKEGLGAIGKTLFSTPDRTFMTMTGVQALGNAFTAHMQQEQEDRRFEFEKRKYEEGKAGARINPAEGYASSTMAPRGVINRAKQEGGYARPTSMTASEALNMRKAGAI